MCSSVQLLNLNPHEGPVTFSIMSRTLPYMFQVLGIHVTMSSPEHGMACHAHNVPGHAGAMVRQAMMLKRNSELSREASRPLFGADFGDLRRCDLEILYDF